MLIRSEIVTKYILYPVYLAHTTHLFNYNVTISMMSVLTVANYVTQQLAVLGRLSDGHEAALGSELSGFNM
jgi:hypothetical protein